MSNTTVQMQAAIERAMVGDQKAHMELISHAYHRLIALCSGRLRKFTSLRFVPNDTSQVLEQLMKRLTNDWERFLTQAQGISPEARSHEYFRWCNQAISYILKEFNRRASRGLAGKTRTVSQLGTGDSEQVFDPVEPRPSHEESIESNELLEQLLAEIELLPADQKQIVDLYDFNDLTFSEIGTMLGIDESTARLRRNKALLTLRRRFTQFDWQ